MANILAIDTSSDTCSVSLCRENEIFNFHQELPQKHTENLLSVIKDLLVEADLEFPDLEIVAVGNGPGSYTGIRLSCAVAQGISFSHGVNGAKISSLELLSLEINQKTSSNEVIAISESNLGKIYVVQSSFYGGKLKSNFELLSQDEFRLDKYPQDSVFVGKGCSLFSEVENKLPDSSPNTFYLIDYLQKYSKDINYISPEEILPIYLNDESSWRKIK